MTRYRVIAHGMHETEINQAKGIIKDGQATEAFVTGVVDDVQMEELRKQGLVVQVLTKVDDQNVPVGAVKAETPASGTMAIPGQRRSLSISRTLESKPARVQEIELSRPSVYLIEIKGPLLPEYSQRLKALGVELLEGYHNDFYTAFLTPQQVSSVGALNFVASLELYDSTPTAPRRGGALESLSVTPPAGDTHRMVTYDVRLHRAEDLDKVRGWLADHHVDIAGSSNRKIRIYLLGDSPVFAELVDLPEVERCEEYIQPKLFNDRARVLMKIDSTGGAPFPFDGTGQTVAVADTGIDDKHSDFAGRMASRVALGRPGKTDDPHGHGTHVAGSILGDGNASNGALKGVAPAAKLFFQSLLDSSGGLDGLPLDLDELFEQAYAAGARIHNDSWGAATLSTYTLNSSEVDEFVNRRRDMLIVIAAGNEGQASDRRNTPAGVVDWLSLGAPATAKNALTVGASRSDRTSGGLSQYKWGKAWSDDFPDPPIADESVSGDSEALAAFSSRGPSDDRRIKPDLVAPGTDILSTKSRLAPITNFWGPHANGAYAYMGGTSMATPLVSGCAALVRQYYVSERKHEPSAALLRATLINGTRWLKGRDANESNPAGVVPTGNYDQGFGCVDMSLTIPNPTQAGIELLFEDNWKTPQGQLTATGTRKRFMVTVRGGKPLRICLAYTDPPGRSLQNNLNLFVQTPDNTKLFGNQQLRQSLNIPDVDNNVEIVRIDNPKPGSYLIQVTATNLLRSPQDFALIVTGDVGGSKLQSMVG
jgi:serine protease AprX